MNQEKLRVKTALISVSDKSNVIEFAEALQDLGVQLISTGGTGKALKEAGIAYQPVSQVTDFPEMMQGRVKTLHPKIHAGILGLRDVHHKEAQAHDISWIDLIIVNLYPFQAVTQTGCDFDTAIEHIDVGGPAMLRAAAKNMGWTGVVVNPSDYSQVLEELKAGGLSFETRKTLATKAFQHSSDYDAYIFNYLQHQAAPAEKKPPFMLSDDTLRLELPCLETLRYGENPHQEAALFQNTETYGLANALILQGKTLSYNNLVDAEAALQCVREFSEPACVIVKHANPCGVARATSIEEAYTKAFAADSKSAFGGIIALNRECTETIAAQVASIFMEVIIAPDFTEEALRLLSKKPHLRVLRLEAWEKISNPWQFKTISGGVLVQSTDHQQLSPQDLKIVTRVMPTPQVIEELLFAWRVVKHLKSNAIALTREGVSVGLGAGQVSRIDALELALKKASASLEGVVLASDAFFPFRDSIDLVAKTPIRAIIQPGGSIKDFEIIQACDEHGIAMVFTGIRAFAH